MIDALLISNGVLWLLVIGLALTVLALTRQVGLLHERISTSARGRRGGFGSRLSMHRRLARGGH